MRYAGIEHMGSHSALRWSPVELALAGAGARVASVGGVTEADCANILRVTGGPGGGGCC